MKLCLYVIFQWLKVLSHVNPFYVKHRDEINSMNVNDLKNGFRLGIEKMKKNALKTVQKEDDSNESVLEDDVQHIRDEQAFSQTKKKEPDTNNDDNDGIEIYQHSVIFENLSSESSTPDMETKNFLESFANAMDC